MADWNGADRGTLAREVDAFLSKGSLNVAGLAIRAASLCATLDPIQDSDHRTSYHGDSGGKPSTEYLGWTLAAMCQSKAVALLGRKASISVSREHLHAMVEQCIGPSGLDLSKLRSVVEQL